MCVRRGRRWGDGLAQQRHQSGGDDEADHDRGKGIGELIELLDADRELLVTEDGVAHTRADAARSAVSAFRALGGGW